MYGSSAEGASPEAGAPEISPFLSFSRSTDLARDGKDLPSGLMGQTAEVEKAILQLIQRELELWDRRLFGPDEAAKWVLESLTERGFRIDRRTDRPRG
jgi:hypothetical protein